MIKKAIRFVGVAFLCAGAALVALAVVSIFLIFVLPISWFEGPLLIVGLTAWLSGLLLMIASILATIGALLVGASQVN